MFRTAFVAFDKPGICFDPDEGMTEQSHAASCDVDNILARYSNTGVIERSTEFKAQYGDYTDFPDYQISLNQIRGAQALFDALPAKVRARFDNDPARLLSFCQDESNLDEMVELGLAEKPMPDNVVSEPKGDG